MLPGARTPDGAIYADTTVPVGGEPFLGGFALNDSDALFVLDDPGTRFNGGHMTTDAGQLCLDFGGVIAGYVNGLPVTAAGQLVAQLNQPVSPGDSYVGGIRVGPLGGVYIVDTAPPVPVGFSSGFSAGFGV